MSVRQLTTFAPGSQPTPASAAPAMSTVNLAARQRMLSQRLVLQTVLAADHPLPHLDDARKTLALFSDSQARLTDTIRGMEPPAATALRAVYDGPRGVAALVDDFARCAADALDAIAAASGRRAAAVAALVECNDGVLEALNRATSAFDGIDSARTASTVRELGDIVQAINRVAREAKVVSFNAQVMAARAGQHGREFAVVANVLSGITGQIDGLSVKAGQLVGAPH